MLTRLFPKQIDNHYPGRALAIWLLVPLVLLKLLQRANVAWGDSRHILETWDRVPVGTFPTAAAYHLVFLFASWGLGILVLGLLGIVVLLRYRRMIPLLYLLLLIEQLGRRRCRRSTSIGRWCPSWPVPPTSSTGASSC